MFYDFENPDPFLRLGDIIRGFQHIQPNFDKLEENPLSFSLKIEKVEFFVVLTPCCSIEESKITITPLKKIIPTYFTNSHLSKDFTIINRIMPSEYLVPPEHWEKLPNEKKNEIIGEGPSFSFKNFFIYSSNSLLPIYSISYKGSIYETGYYQIDFKDAYSLESKHIQREMNFPKVLQLSKETRQELREKLSSYYYRVPEVDKIC
jgi:hypothetical protein